MEKFNYYLEQVLEDRLIHNELQYYEGILDRLEQAFDSPYVPAAAVAVLAASIPIVIGGELKYSNEIKDIRNQAIEQFKKTNKAQFVIKNVDYTFKFNITVKPGIDKIIISDKTDGKDVQVFVMLPESMDQNLYEKQIKDIIQKYRRQVGHKLYRDPKRLIINKGK